MVLATHTKILIAGGAISGEGGGLLLSSLILTMDVNLLQGLSQGVSQGTGFATALGGMFVLPYMIIGIVSLCVGIPILIVGLVKRQKVLAEK